MRLVELAHSKIKKALRPGDLCIDATAGNGHDSLFLATEVGPQGFVYAFDIQEDALIKTTERLKENNLSDRLKTVLASHSAIKTFVDEKHKGNIQVAMFNLGYLPGGNHQIVTTANSTTSALTSTYSVLKEGGVITVLCYRGHPQGLNETNEVINLCEKEMWKHETYEGNSNPESPILICINKI
jgi:ubiquinone/menaquinone biosynthesis C-methylase UbiE